MDKENGGAVCCPSELQRWLCQLIIILFKQFLSVIEMSWVGDRNHHSQLNIAGHWPRNDRPANNSMISISVWTAKSSLIRQHRKAAEKFALFLCKLIETVFGNKTPNKWSLIFLLSSIRLIIMGLKWQWRPGKDTSYPRPLNLELRHSSTRRRTVLERFWSWSRAKIMALTHRK